MSPLNGSCHSRGNTGKPRRSPSRLLEFAFTVGFEQQWQVYELRGGIAPAEGFVQKYMQRSRGQPFLAANHVRHLHQVVVDNIGKVISRQVIGTLIKYLVVEDVALDSHTATQQVVDFDIATRLDAETHHILSAVVDEGSFTSSAGNVSELRIDIRVDASYWKLAISLRLASSSSGVSKAI